MNKEGESSPSIWTIGHSTHPIETFIAMLQSFSISILTDIRNYPGSKRYPHFNKEALEMALKQDGIQYVHLKELGGRRKPSPDSINTNWRNEAFRGYADYMGTTEFKNAIVQLEDIASTQRTAYMCSEAVWWSCHRALVSDYLKIRGWKVMHIMGMGKTTEHPYTSAARIVDGELRYDSPALF
jgi:uncharacterized protein (DUF488 family)